MATLASHLLCSQPCQSIPMFGLVMEYIIDLWEIRRVEIPCSTQLQSQSSAGDLRDGTVVGGQRRGKFGEFSHSCRVTGKISITDDLLCVR